MRICVDGSLRLGNSSGNTPDTEITSGGIARFGRSGTTNGRIFTGNPEATGDNNAHNIPGIEMRQSGRFTSRSDQCLIGINNGNTPIWVWSNTPMADGVER